MRVSLQSGLLVASVCGSICQAHVTAFDEMVQNLKTAVSCDVVGFAGSMGVDAFSPLTLSTFVDPVADVFNYSTIPGTTYLGQPASISGSGYFDAGINKYVFSSLFTLGDQSMINNGTIELIPHRTHVPKSRVAEYRWGDDGTGYYRMERVYIDFTGEADGSVSSKGQWYSYEKLKLLKISDDKDTYDPKTGGCTWTKWYTDNDQSYNYNGGSDPTTGVGYLVTAITPSPGALVALGCGLGVLSRRRRG